MKKILCLLVVLAAFLCACGKKEPQVTEATTFPTREPTQMTQGATIVTTAPTQETSAEPTEEPTAAPTAAPTEAVTTAPVTVATAAPATKPTATPATIAVTKVTAASTVATVVPTSKATAAPTTVPTVAPTTKPVAVPTTVPATKATIAATTVPIVVPTTKATVAPVTIPTKPATEPTVAHQCTYVTLDLPSAAVMAVEADPLGAGRTYARFAYDSYCDYTTKICTGCYNIDLNATHFKYSQREAAQIMLDYVNNLRAEVWGTDAYDLSIDNVCQKSAEKRAVQLITNYSHEGANTPGECITSRLSLYEQFISLKNSPLHYDVMIRKDNQYFGYGYASNESEGWVATQGFGCMTFG